MNRDHTTRYLLLVHSDTTRWDQVADHDAPPDEQIDGHARLIDDLARAGALVRHSPLTHPRNALRVRVRDGHPDVAPAPAEPDPIAGFYLVECDDEAEAVGIAARIPDAATHHITVRPCLTVPGIPTDPAPHAASEPE